MTTCILCKSSKKDDVLYGEFLTNENMGVHTYCLYLSSNLAQNGDDDEGFLGFLEADIRKEVHRISQLKCCYCHRTYANIGCCERKCRRSFHLICGLENDCQNQYCHNFRSFCHIHIRKGQQRPAASETCLICYENVCADVEKFNPITMIQAPCCRNGWFHKLCLQKCAKISGYFFKCPLCNDEKVFREKLPAKGIFIPNQDAAWELEPNAFAELLERPSECAAIKCLNKNGRKSKIDSNPFVMCITCGSTAMHRLCLPNGGLTFHCADCTIAIEQDDSGRGCLSSHENEWNHNDEDDEIDVCNVSDNEDTLIIRGLKERQTNEETQNIREIGLRLKPDDNGQKTNVSSESGYKACKESDNKLYRSDHSDGDYSETSSEEEEELVYKLSNSKTNKRCDKTSISSDESIIKLVNRKRAILLDSEDEHVLCKTRRLNVRETRARPKSQKTTIAITSDTDNSDTVEIKSSANSSILTDDDDNDPLENFTEIIERQKNMSCIALRTRRKSQYVERAQNLNSSIEPQDIKTAMSIKSTDSKDQIKKDNKTNIETSRSSQCTNVNITANPDNKRRHFKQLKNEANTNSYDSSHTLDVSFVAKRTSRNSMACKHDNNSQKEYHNEDSNTNTSAKEFFHEKFKIYEKLHESVEDKDEHYDCETDVYKDLQESDVDDFVGTPRDNVSFVYISSHDEDDESKKSSIIDLELSCIANRTRKRKSLKHFQQTLDDTEDSKSSSISTTSRLSACTDRTSYSSSSATSSASSSTSSSASSSASASSIRSLHNVNIKKRRSLRLSSSEDSESTSSFKMKTVSSRYLEKFPQCNFLNTKCVSKSSLNYANIYYPHSQYHPHTNNRRRV